MDEKALVTQAAEELYSEVHSFVCDLQPKLTTATVTFSQLLEHASTELFFGGLDKADQTVENHEVIQQVFRAHFQKAFDEAAASVNGYFHPALTEGVFKITGTNTVN